MRKQFNAPRASLPSLRHNKNIPRNLQPALSHPQSPCSLVPCLTHVLALASAVPPPPCAPESKSLPARLQQARPLQSQWSPDHSPSLRTASIAPAAYTPTPRKRPPRFCSASSPCSPEESSCAPALAARPEPAPARFAEWH